jgi:hypothetical protein
MLAYHWEFGGDGNDTKMYLYNAKSFAPGVLYSYLLTSSQQCWHHFVGMLSQRHSRPSIEISSAMIAENTGTTSKRIVYNQTYPRPPFEAH